MFGGVDRYFSLGINYIIIELRIAKGDNFMYNWFLPLMKTKRCKVCISRVYLKVVHFLITPVKYLIIINQISTLLFIFFFTRDQGQYFYKIIFYFV